MELRDNEITENTTLRIILTIRNSDTSIKSLSGATFSAVMGRTGLSVAGVATVINGATGTVQVVFPLATNMKGHAVASLHMTSGGVTQCVWRERFQVLGNLE